MKKIIQFIIGIILLVLIIIFSVLNSDSYLSSILNIKFGTYKASNTNFISDFNYENGSLYVKMVGYNADVNNYEDLKFWIDDNLEIMSIRLLNKDFFEIGKISFTKNDIYINNGILYANKKIDIKKSDMKKIQNGYFQYINGIIKTE